MGSCSEGPCQFSLALGADNTITIHNDNSTSSCWGSGDGLISADGTSISNVKCTVVPECQRVANGKITASRITQWVDKQYPYEAGVHYTIVWDVTGSEAGENRMWPAWHRTVMHAALIPPSIN